MWHKQVACWLVVVGVTSPAGAEIINVPEDFPTIQEAINAAGGGDEIVVAPGTYNEAIDLLGKNVVLRSSDGPEVTVIDAAGLEASVVVGASSGTTLDGFTLTHGIGTRIQGNGESARVGGGMFNDGGSPTVRDCIFRANSADGDRVRGAGGGGMFNRNGASPTISRCVFEQNEAYRGGAINNFNGANPTIADCLFDRNQAEGGGGIYNLDFCEPVILDSTFLENQGRTSAGGIGIVLFCSPRIERCRFLKNRVPTGRGAGIWMGGTNTAVIRDCQFCENSAHGSGGGIFAGGLGTDPLIERCLIQRNEAHRPDWGGGMYSSWNALPFVVDTMLCDNNPQDRVGPWEDGGGNSEGQPCEAACFEDLDRSGAVGFDDLLLVLAGWGECLPGLCPLDLDCSNAVDFGDVLAVLATWGPCPG